MLGSLFSYSQTIDKILAVIDEEIILASDLENQYQYYLKNGQKDDGTLRCTIFESLLTNKLLLTKAKLDSLKVSDERVEEELNHRINMIVKQVGSEAEVEKIYGKSILQMKMDLRQELKEQLLVEEQKKKIFASIQITPREVKQFFQSIPKDSLPFLPAEVEIAHIVMAPKPSEASKKVAKQKLEELRARIASGSDSFEMLAKVYSEDPGSAEQGGFLGEFSKGDMVPEFEEVLFNLKENELSSVFETPYGFHLAKLHKRTNERLSASHILIRPKIDAKDEEAIKLKLKALRSAILRDSIKFAEAARIFSEDSRTKDNGGTITSATGESSIPLDQLDADLYLKIDQMKENEISEPLEILNPRGYPSRTYHIILLKKRLPPHRASLKTDYQKFMKAALQAKQSEELEKWFHKTKQQIYIEIKNNECSQALQNWK
ncbi:MAG: peptidylprolyl isomerase [Bacteroidia bacterium]|nr:peptidylprolyl isomerase [Bacteroidia bacterium]